METADSSESTFAENDVVRKMKGTQEHWRYIPVCWLKLTEMLNYTPSLYHHPKYILDESKLNPPFGHEEKGEQPLTIATSFQNETATSVRAGYIQRRGRSEHPSCMQQVCE